MKYLRFFLIISICFILFSCGEKKEIPVIKLGHAPHDHHAALYVAAAKGEYFKDKAGYYLKEIVRKKEYELHNRKSQIAKIEIESGTGGIYLIRKLDEKIIDVSFGGVPAMIDMIDKGSSIKILSPVMTEGAALVVSEDIPVNGWAEFIQYIKDSDRPLRIGYKVDVSVQNLIFEAALREEGITFSDNIQDRVSDVILINLHGPKNLIPSLESEIIDGFVVMQPYPALAEYKKSGKIIAPLSSLPPQGRWKDYPCCAFAAGKDFINTHPAVAEALVTLFYHAAEYISENIKESAGITAGWLDMPEQVEAESLPTINYTNKYNDAWDSGVDFWIESLIMRGLLSGTVKEAYKNSAVHEQIYDKTFYNKLNDKSGN